MKISMIKALTALVLMGVAVDSLASTPLNGGQTNGRTVYISDVELCNDGTLMLKLSFYPEEVCTGSYPAICNSIAPAWFYVSPDDTTDNSYQRLVSTASVAEANQYQVKYFSSTQSAVSMSCNNITATTAGEISVLEILNHG